MESTQLRAFQKLSMKTSTSLIHSHPSQFTYRSFGTAQGERESEADVVLDLARKTLNAQRRYQPELSEYRVHTPPTTTSHRADTYIMLVSLGHEHSSALIQLWLCTANNHHQCCDGAFYQQTMEKVIVFCVLTLKLSTHAALLDVSPLS